MKAIRVHGRFTLSREYTKAIFNLRVIVLLDKRRFIVHRKRVFEYYRLNGLHNFVTTLSSHAFTTFLS
jgi:hypothetical protein